ncbi:unnamed protein product [Ceutorhynchus assimilis]|uniref:Uncharacterized protein n=1 Tax=Ceutorhynchus assimilis TaxID=467358 RepID=A0A9N9QKL4_9CUCU|nr:unnamed protein product [Ceutorhynchus assimilis]
MANPNCPNSKYDHMLNPTCKNKQSTQIPSKTTKAMNHSAWEGHSNEKKFMDALTNLMNESWMVVCQMREKSGLNAQYQMSTTEIAKRIDDISRKLEEKYREVAALEERKSKLLNKTSTRGVGTPARQPGYPPRPPGMPLNATSSPLYGASLPPFAPYGPRLPPSALSSQRRVMPPIGSPARATSCRNDCPGSGAPPGPYRTF